MRHLAQDRNPLASILAMDGGWRYPRAAGEA
jgi:hypothetical protein